MAEFASAADAPAARVVIHTMGFDHDMVQHAMAQAGGNEQLAINLILNGEVHGAATASSSAAFFAASAAGFSGPASGFGSAFAPSVHGAVTASTSAFSIVAPALSSSSSSKSTTIHLSFSDQFIRKRVPLWLDADGIPLPPTGQRAQIMCAIELMQAAAWFFARQSPGIKRHREEPPPPLGYMLREFSPCVPVRVMCGCVATACRRLATAPAGMYVIYRTTWRWAAWIMERVTRGHVKKVQVRLQRRACCDARCACRASACVCVTRAAAHTG
jgi:hypothetical protein